jgi:inward rectifier potassium channel
MSPHSDPSHQSLHPQSFHFRALINKQGRLNVHGNRQLRNPFSDLYHFFLSLSWPKFFIFVATIYFLTNLFFGILFFICGVDALGEGHSAGLDRFGHCVFLSIEDMTAVDYSRVGHVGILPYILMTIQAFLGLLTLAVITGLFYARFSRATARIIFSNKAIVGNHNGKLCFFFRIANERLNQIAEAHMSLHLTKNEISLEGEHTRKFYDLKLERDHTPLFALSWTVRHFIDEKSPLFGMDEKKMHEAQMGILASLTGIDETFSQPIIARHSYSLEDIVYNKRFKDIIVWHDKKVQIDLKGIHDVHELELAAALK